MPQVLNVRHLPGYAEKRPVLPPGAVYIGRPMPQYALPGSKWANKRLKNQNDDEERARSIAAYETRLRCDPVRLAEVPELRGCDLYCWCAPKPCHGDVLLRLRTCLDRLLRDIHARMRHEHCGGRAAKAELLTATEAASSGLVRRIVLRGGP